MSNRIRLAYTQATLPENQGRKFKLRVITTLGDMPVDVSVYPYMKPADPIRCTRAVDMLICRDGDGCEYLFNDYQIVVVVIVWDA